MIELRGPQPETISRLRYSISAKGAGRRRPLMVSPTGSGKTVMFSYLSSALRAAGKRVCIMAHRDELLTQISTTLRGFGVQHGMISRTERQYDRRLLVHVAGAMSLVRRLDSVAVPDYAIVDEAHHGTSKSTWGKIIAHWYERNPALIVIGVTATPERLDGAGLGQVFDDLVIAPGTGELIADGWLSPYKIFGPPNAFDDSAARTRSGRLREKDIQGVVDKPRITGDLIEHYRKHCDFAPIVPFCYSIEHAEHVAENFRSAGYRAASIDGKMARKQRKQLVSDFASGQLHCLTSQELISEGFDVPGIIAVASLRPTDSLALCLQQWGRSLRPIWAPGSDMTTREGRLAGIANGPKPHAFIFDHVGNYKRHGFPCDDRAWSLEGHAGEKKEKDPDDIAIKQCPAPCAAINRGNALVCTECGRPFTFVKKTRSVETVDGELQAIDVTQKRVEFIQSRAGAQTLEDLIEVGRKRGMKNAEGWARHVYKARQEKAARSSVAESPTGLF